MISKKQKETAKELIKLKTQFLTIRKLGTNAGFYQTWLNTVKNFKNDEVAFNVLNQQYFENILPQKKYKYKDFKTFLAMNKI